MNHLGMLRLGSYRLGSVHITFLPQLLGLSQHLIDGIVPGAQGCLYIHADGHECVTEQRIQERFLHLAFV